ncbi:MAG: S8 family serine peptidase [Methanomassiliicoccales archaeon]|nr:MAG: S8 family serine peptidase [Methanomassiliicoccales archaeon]
MKKSGISLLVLILLLIPIFGSAGEIFENDADLDILDSKLATRLNEASPNDPLEVIIQFKDEVNEMDIGLLSALNFEVKRTFHVIPAVYAIGTKSSILRLTHYSRTFHIEYNEPLEYLMDESTNTINATKVWASQIVDYKNRTWMDADNTPLHIDGSGITVVVVDSGVDAGHPDLDYREKTIMNLKSDLDGGYTEAENTDTSSGHGTHCSGTIAGNGEASGGARRGVAPGANLIGISTGEAVAILNAVGALEWVYDHSRPNANPYNIKAVSNSWGSSGEYNPDNAINQITRKITHENNVAVVFAAGNEGEENHDGHAVTTNPYSLEPGVLSIAAMERDGSGIAYFSSRGSAEDNFTWPDIGAPGVHIWATEARKTLISAMRKQDPSDAQDGYYMSISGTSMATPHVSGLCALLWQAAPSLRVSEIYDEYSVLDDDEYWSNPESRIHETEAIMKLTARYVQPAQDNGVPTNFSLGINDLPYDFGQGYGIVRADHAVALALTLEEMRRTDEDVTVMDAYRRYFNITTNGTTSDKTNVLATSWIGDWSMFTDPENPVSSFTTHHPRQVFIHNRTSRVIVDLQYEPISSTDFESSTLWVVIDYDGDGNIDWSGDSSFSTEGIRHEEIDLGGGGAQTGQLWEINVRGYAGKIRRWEGPNFGENEFNEAIIEYALSIQMVFDLGEDEVIQYDTGDLHARIAQPEFGEPTPEYGGNGTIEMKTYFYDLTRVYMVEEAPPIEPKEEGFPFWILIIVVILAGLLGFYYWKYKMTPKKEGTIATDSTQPTPEAPIQGEIVEAEVVTEPAPSDSQPS